MEPPQGTGSRPFEREKQVSLRNVARSHLAWFQIGKRGPRRKGINNMKAKCKKIGYRPQRLAVIRASQTISMRRNVAVMSLCTGVVSPRNLP